MSLISLTVYDIYCWDYYNNKYVKNPRFKCHPEHTYMVVFNVSDGYDDFRGQNARQYEMFKTDLADKVNVLYESPVAVNTNMGVGNRNVLVIFEAKNGEI